jgi:hypothetical protein
MRMRAMLAALLLSGCACQSATPVPALPPPAPVAEPAAAPPVGTTPAATVARLYRDAERQEVPAIFKSDATVPFIRRIRLAHRNAERAVLALEREGGHTRPRTLATASAAVRALQEAIDAPPDAARAAESGEPP